ncbi:hypothetical protein JOB18_038242 [Solea senegalensis]|uniref:Uncharacterized protein n=1 Tax=Solea senegalensis TaxID=28829 RepID=A0AAV6QZG0_SOLSE|nr:hypothetical protein JOB18_038242 [Solea senegalensis]
MDHFHAAFVDCVRVTTRGQKPALLLFTRRQLQSEGRREGRRDVCLQTGNYVKQQQQRRRQRRQQQTPTRFELVETKKKRANIKADAAGACQLSRNS